MNYIESELLRQKELLFRLFSNRDGMDAPQEKVGIRTYEAEDPLEPGGQKREGHGETDFPVYQAGGLARQELELPSIYQTAAARPESKQQGAGTNADQSGPAASQQAPAKRGGTAVGGRAGGKARSPGQSLTEGQESGVILTERVYSAEAGEPSTARALSLCVERDARRYDGGYPLY